MLINSAAFNIHRRLACNRTRASEVFMIFALILHDRFSLSLMRRLLLLSGVFIAIALLNGCSITTGMTAAGMSQHSKIDLPGPKGAETLPAYVSVQDITANMIVALEQKKGTQPRRAKSTGAQTLIDNYIYTLGPGDIISVTVWDHPELTIPAGSFRSAQASGNRVAQDGTIYYPFVGVVKVAGLTLAKVRELLTQKLDKYIEGVQLDVHMVAYRSKQVYIVGEVVKPGAHQITDIPPSILEMVNRTGGFTGEADHSNITLARAGTTYRVDLQALYENGDHSQNILLNPGDIVNVPDRQLNKIFVLGEVRQPGSFLMSKHRKTLAEALADAGGVNPLTSDAGQVYVVRGNSQQSAIYHLDASSPDALILADRFPLQARDVVYVDAADIVQLSRVMSNIFVTLGTLSTLRSDWVLNFPLNNGQN